MTITKTNKMKKKNTIITNAEKKVMYKLTVFIMRTDSDGNSKPEEITELFHENSSIENRIQAISKYVSFLDTLREAVEKKHDNFACFDCEKIRSVEDFLSFRLTISFIRPDGKEFEILGYSDDKNEIIDGLLDEYHTYVKFGFELRDVILVELYGMPFYVLGGIDSIVCLKTKMVVSERISEQGRIKKYPHSVELKREISRNFKLFKRTIYLKVLKPKSVTHPKLFIKSIRHPHPRKKYY